MIQKLLIAAMLAGAVATAGAATQSSDVVGPTLVVGKGTVMVSNGSQFVTAKPGQVLKPGDRVMVLQGASATVNYGNGRASALPPGSLSDIGSMTAVTAGTNKKIGPMYAQAVGDADEHHCRDSEGHPLLDSDGHERKCGGYYTGEEHLYAVAGTVAVIALVAVGLSSLGNSQDHENPISAP